MKTAFVLLAMLALASAACPNQCSGHGRCETNDKCHCYEQTNTPWGQRNGWTGADCSLRSCPLGVSFDQISNLDDRFTPPVYVGVSAVGGVDVSTTDRSNLVVVLNQDYQLNRDETIYVRVGADTAGFETFQWRFEEDSFYQQPVSAINGGTQRELDRAQGYELKDHNDGSTRTGIVIYFNEVDDLDAGHEWKFTVRHNNRISFRANNDNTLHQMVECSGRGNCNSATGRCECSVGYSGEACQRTTCPSDCSGHGVCQDERRFVEDASGSYDSNAIGTMAYDARKQMGCLCDLGFRGPDCSMIECPSGPDPLRLADGVDGETATEGRDCSGRGICDYGSGQCSCFKGYFGERCEEQSSFL